MDLPVALKARALAAADPVASLLRKPYVWLGRASRPQINRKPFYESDCQGQTGSSLNAGASFPWQSALKIWSREFIGWFCGAPEFGYRDAEQGYAKGFADTSEVRTYSLVIHEVRVDGHLGFTRVTFNQTATASGKRSLTAFKSYEIWRRELDGSWRIVRTISYPQPAS